MVCRRMNVFNGYGARSGGLHGTSAEKYGASGKAAQQELALRKCRHGLVSEKLIQQVYWRTTVTGNIGGLR